MSHEDSIRAKAMQQITANEFKRINGMVMRMVVLLFKTVWFRTDELETALATNKLTKEEIYEALDYFESEGYIEVRSIEGRQAVRLSDVHVEDVEIKLTGEGKKVAYGIKTDDAIDL